MRRLLSMVYEVVADLSWSTEGSALFLYIVSDIDVFISVGGGGLEGRSINENATILSNSS